MLIGLTGNIGSGKSLAAGLLAQAGAAVIDADSVGHQVLLSAGPAYAGVIKVFGREFLNSQGELDRRRLGAFVFADQSGERLRRLESLTHPAILKQIDGLIANYRAQGYELIVIEAALFFDTPLEALVDEIWVIRASRQVLLRRVAARDHCGQEAAGRRLDQQLSADELAARADRVFDNDGEPQQLARQLDQALSALPGGIPMKKRQ